jgi:hypothetical protein
MTINPIPLPSELLRKPPEREVIIEEASPEQEVEIIEEVAPESEPVAEVAEHEDELADLFEVPQPDDHDIYSDDLVETDEAEDLSDLTSVSREDVMGSRPKSKAKYRIVRRPRTARRFVPPTTLGGMQS